jgi:hypothetical protein
VRLPTAKFMSASKLSHSFGQWCHYGLHICRNTLICVGKMSEIKLLCDKVQKIFLKSVNKYSTNCGKETCIQHKCVLHRIFLCSWEYKVKSNVTHSLINFNHLMWKQKVTMNFRQNWLITCVLKVYFHTEPISSRTKLVMLMSYLDDVHKGYANFPKLYDPPQNSMHTAHKLLRT